MDELSLKDKVDLLFQQQLQQVQPETRKMKLPRRAKVNKRKAKKGWVGVVTIDEKGFISGEKQKIFDSTFRVKDGTYHSSNGQEILMWDGKFPVIFQSPRKINPINFVQGNDETYGQKYVLARMLGDSIKIKQKAGNIIIWILIAGAAIFGISQFM